MNRSMLPGDIRRGNRDKANGTVQKVKEEKRRGHYRDGLHSYSVHLFR